MGGRFLSFSETAFEPRFRECRPIVDADQIVVGLLGAIPVDEGWNEICKKAEEALEEADGKLSIQDKDLVHRRGAFPAYNLGLSHGGGQGVTHSIPPHAFLPLLTLEWP